MNRTQKKIIGIGLTTLGIIFAGIVLAHSLYYAPDTDVAPANTATSSVTAGNVTAGKPQVVPVTSSAKPLRLIIPKLDISAGIQYVGVKPSGQMANPSNFTDVGWYKDGTVPGQPGSAVMAGHVDNALALDGVFKELKQLEPGDVVNITRRDGKKLTFKVDRLVYYGYQDTPSEKIFLSSDGKAHLNLITCAGTWLKNARSYDQRLVVFTTLVE